MASGKTDGEARGADEALQAVCVGGRDPINGAGDVVAAGFEPCRGRSVRLRHCGSGNCALDVHRWCVGAVG